MWCFDFCHIFHSLLYLRLKLHGTFVLLRYVGRIAPNFYGSNAYESGQVNFRESLKLKIIIGCSKLLLFLLSCSCLHSVFCSFFQIDEWLDYAPVLSSGSTFENGCKNVDEYLSGNTFLVGHNLSIADIAIWSGLAGKKFSRVQNVNA